MAAGALATACSDTQTGTADVGGVSDTPSSPDSSGTDGSSPEASGIDTTSLDTSGPGPADAGADTHALDGETPADASTSPLDSDSGMPDSEEPVVTVGLEITPADVLVMTVLEGEPMSLGLGAQLVYSDGSTADVTNGVVWTTSAPDVVSIAEDGTPWATGETWGQALVIALYQGLPATCSVTIKIELAPVVIHDNVTEEEAAAFDAGGPSTSDGAPIWAYPLADSVLPCGMYPPLLQWLPGDDNAWFRVVLTNLFDGEVTIYTTSDAYQPDRATWEGICGSGGPLALELSGAASLATDEPRRTAEPLEVIGASASLEGVVYYWEILPLSQTGSIQRVDSAESIPASVPVFDEEPKGTTACRGCHALSLDGSKLAYGYNGPEVAPVAPAKGKGFLAVSLAEDPYPPVVGPDGAAGVQTIVFDPPGSRLVIGDMEGMWLASLEADDGLGYAKVGDILTKTDYDGAKRPETPSWSPDGSHLAFTLRVLDGSLPGGAAIMLSEWDFEAETFLPPTELVGIDSVPGRPYHDYPTWSPDSQWIVARGSGTDLGIGQTPQATDIGFTLIDAVTGEARPLDLAGPAGQTYGRPSFSPFEEGGYFWLVFYSDRAYGHAKPPGLKQLWVAAIDSSPGDGDPSHPALWLPGQDLAGINLSAFWARPACTVEAEVCEVDDDCCVGLECYFWDGTTQGTCEPLDCELPGEYCDLKNANCCPGYECLVSLSGTSSCQLEETPP